MWFTQSEIDSLEEEVSLVGSTGGGSWGLGTGAVFQLLLLLVTLVQFRIQLKKKCHFRWD